jgi:hypothetical protein
MEMKDWSKFNEELDEHLKMVRNSFLGQTMSFEDSLIQDKDGDEETEEEKKAMENELVAFLKIGEEKKADLLGKVNSIYDKKNARIKALKEALKAHEIQINNYEDNKKICEKSCQTIEGYLGDKDGFILFLSKAFQNQHNELNELKDVREVVAKKKNEYDNLFSCKFFSFALLIFGCIIAQVFLFSKLTECGGQSDDVLVKCILVAAMIVLFVCEVYSILGIFRLSRKKTNILQRLDLIMNKIDMRKVSKFEIDRDLERVLEEMK